MGKQGPCYHCGITTTPLWRNGPPDKPVLCNACGSRWRTKGTLLNYMPMHSGGFGVGTENARWPMKSANRPPVLAPEKPTSRKRKELPSDGNTESGLSKTSTYVSSSVDEDVSTRSSLGSEMSTFEGPLSNVVHSASAVPVRGTPWDTPVPSRRRTSMFRSRASSGKITRNLVSLDDQEVSSVTCPSSDILFESKSPLVAVEIGLGSVFIRPPARRLCQEPESEASSLLIDNSSKACEHAEVFSRGGPKRVPRLCSDNNRPEPIPAVSPRGKEKLRPALKRPEAGRAHSDKHYNSRTLLENSPYNKRDVLQSTKSPLVHLELKDIVNYDTFTGLLADQEQLQLVKFLASVDASQCPESLRSMFASSQFEGALSNFQRLLSEGMFDSPENGLNPRVLQHYQQLLSVTDLTASGWMESMSQLQTRNKRRVEPGAKDKAKDTEGAHPVPGQLSQGQTKQREATAGKGVQFCHSSQMTEKETKVHPSQHPLDVCGAPSARAGSSSGADSKKAVSLMEEGHDSGGEQDDGLLVEVPSSFCHSDSLLLRKPWTDYSKHNMNNNSDSLLITTTNNNNNNTNNNSNNVNDGGDDLIVTNTWQAADWDGGLIWNNKVESGLRR